MTPEGIREAYQSLSEALTSTGLGWIVHQVEDRVREGRPVEKEARIFKDEEPGKQVHPTDGEAAGATARRPGKPTLMMTLEPWTDDCRLQFLIDAVRHGIVYAADVENEQLKLLRRYGDVQTVMFAPEFVAEVVAADSAALVGKRVVGEINLACKDCSWCRKGLGRHCPHRTVLGIVKHPGAFSELFTLPERNLHILPEGLPLERAVFAEPLAAACEILDQVSIPCGSRVAVLGDGKLGLLVAMLLNVYGYRVHQFGRHADKLRISAAAGVDTARPNGKLPEAEFDWVVDVTGNAEGLRSAAAMVRPRGTLILKSTVHGTVGIDTAPIIVNEITLVGSRCGRLESALPLLDHGLIPVEKMIADRFDLSHAPQAFERAAQRGTMKVLLAP